MTPDLFRRLSENGVTECPLDDIPYAGFLGFSLRREGDDIALHLRFDPSHVGSPGRYHGGVVGAALEFAAMSELMWRAYRAGKAIEALPKPISLTVDYLREARCVDLYANAVIVRQGRRVASIRASAWQEAGQEQPVAEAQLHFLMAH